MAGSVGIVGAGIAAASCARALAAAGVRSTVYEQGRSAGGRLATRASRESAVRINHGEKGGKRGCTGGAMWERREAREEERGGEMRRGEEERGERREE